MWINVVYLPWVVLYLMYYEPWGCFSVLLCMWYSILGIGLNVLFSITICRCVLFVFALCGSWHDSMVIMKWDCVVTYKRISVLEASGDTCRDQKINDKHYEVRNNYWLWQLRLWRHKLLTSQACVGSVLEYVMCNLRYTQLHWDRFHFSPAVIPSVLYAHKVCECVSVWVCDRSNQPAQGASFLTI
jgi:hypothetical protein